MDLDSPVKPGNDKGGAGNETEHRGTEKIEIPRLERPAPHLMRGKSRRISPCPGLAGSLNNAGFIGITIGRVP